MRNFAVTGTPYGAAAADRGAQDGPQQRRLDRHRRAAALRVTLAAGQPKLRSMWSTRPSAQSVARPGRSSPGRCRRAAGCAVLVGAERHHASVLALPCTSAVAITISLT